MSIIEDTICKSWEEESKLSAPVREPRKVRGGTEMRQPNMALELGGR